MFQGNVPASAIIVTRDPPFYVNLLEKKDVDQCPDESQHTANSDDDGLNGERERGLAASGRLEVVESLMNFKHVSA